MRSLQLKFLTPMFLEMKKSNSYLLSFIIVNYNGDDKVIDTIKSIYKFVTFNFEIIVFDNSSTDGSPQKLKDEFGENDNFRVILSDKNLGFGKANNRAVKYSKGKYIILFNNDAYLLDGSLNKMIEYYIENDFKGILAPMILNPDSTIQKSWGKYQSILNEILDKYGEKTSIKNFLKKAKKSKIIDAPWVAGTCFIVKKSIYEELNGFDEGFFMYFEDSDFSKRAKEKGYRVAIYRDSKIYHLRGYSASKNKNVVSFEYRRSQLYYYCKHRKKINFYILKFYLLLKFLIRKRKDIISFVKEFRC